MLPFVSEENYMMHLEYVNQLRVKLSALEKIINVSTVRRRKRVDEENTEKATRVKNEVRLHDAYFASFSEREFQRSTFVQQVFVSENELLMMLYKAAMEATHGFVGVERCSNNRLRVFSCSDYLELNDEFDPTLVIDVCEHAYFYDFEFDKERYVRRALAHLSLDRIDDFS